MEEARLVSRPSGGNGEVRLAPHTPVVPHCADYALLWPRVGPMPGVAWSRRRPSLAADCDRTRGAHDWDRDTNYSVRIDRLRRPRIRRATPLACLWGAGSAAASEEEAVEADQRGDRDDSAGRSRQETVCVDRPPAPHPFRAEGSAGRTQVLRRRPPISSRLRVGARREAACSPSRAGGGGASALLWERVAGRATGKCAIQRHASFFCGAPLGVARRAAPRPHFALSKCVRSSSSSRVVSRSSCIVRRIARRRAEEGRRGRRGRGGRAARQVRGRVGEGGSPIGASSHLCPAHTWRRGAQLLCPPVRAR
eukprot:37907-Chlamydomonas_euryale.AAC.1